ncbi:MAG: phage tail tape measure protein, partial [bacterium]|nr:phage tail tape measure protein [bacterium]
MADETKLGSAVIPIRAKLDGLDKDLSEAKGKVEKSASGISGILSKINWAMVGAGVAAIGVGVGAALMKVAGTFDDAMDNIRTKTGATGKDLDALGSSMREVFKTVPVDAEQASDAIADLNRRLGLTGKPLEELSRQMLNLSRITNVDVGDMTESITRVFGDWGIATEEQSAALDTMFKVSQQTGIGIQKLGEQVVFYGAPLRQFGFTFQESAILLGKWNKEGVNSELVLGSLRIALGKFADAGIPARKGLEDIVAKIQKLGPSAEATSLAMDTFGARAGADMAAAILEGRLSIEELVKTISNSQETINKAAGETDDWKESLKLLQNNVEVLVEPLASKLFGAISDVTRGMAEGMQEGGKLREIFDKVGIAASGLWTVTAPLREGLGKIFEFGINIGGGALSQLDNIVATIQGALSGNWQSGPGIDPFSDFFGRLTIQAKNVKDTIKGIFQPEGSELSAEEQHMEGVRPKEWISAPDIDPVTNAFGNLALYIKNDFQPKVEAFKQWWIENIVPMFEQNPPTTKSTEEAFDRLGIAAEGSGNKQVGAIEAARIAYIDFNVELIDAFDNKLMPKIRGYGVELGNFVDDFKERWKRSGPGVQTVVDAVIVAPLKSGADSARALWQGLFGGGEGKGAADTLISIVG